MAPHQSQTLLYWMSLLWIRLSLQYLPAYVDFILFIDTLLARKYVPFEKWVTVQLNYLEMSNIPVGLRIVFIIVKQVSWDEKIKPLWKQSVFFLFFLFAFQMK